jgi:hypothetical protein
MKNVAPCSLVEVYRRFRGACCLHHQGDESLVALMMEAASTSETSVNFYQTTRCNTPEDSHLHTRSHEKLKSHQLQEMFEVQHARNVRKGHGKEDHKIHIPIHILLRLVKRGSFT